VGNAEHYVAVPAGRDAEPVQKFGSFTADLHRMAQWLKACAQSPARLSRAAT
jgi:transposase